MLFRSILKGGIEEDNSSTMACAHRLHEVVIRGARAHHQQQGVPPIPLSTDRAGLPPSLVGKAVDQGRQPGGITPCQGGCSRIWAQDSQIPSLSLKRIGEPQGDGKQLEALKTHLNRPTPCGVGREGSVQGFPDLEFSLSQIGRKQEIGRAHV